MKYGVSIDLFCFLGITLFLLNSLEAINIPVTPVVRTAVVAVKRQPKIPFSASHYNGNDRAPSPETAVVKIKGCFTHSA